MARRNWVVCGADDLIIRVFNYNTCEKVHQWEAHADYIRALAVHPTKSILLSCSDDGTVRSWDWERGWKLQTTFEGHSHYVMAVVFNPKVELTFFKFLGLEYFCHGQLGSHHQGMVIGQCHVQLYPRGS